jgi:hypothetical protein
LCGESPSNFAAKWHCDLRVPVYGAALHSWSGLPLGNGQTGDFSLNTCINNLDRYTHLNCLTSRSSRYSPGAARDMIPLSAFFEAFTLLERHHFKDLVFRLHTTGGSHETDGAFLRIHVIFSLQRKHRHGGGIRKHSSPKTTINRYILRLLILFTFSLLFLGARASTMMSSWSWVMKPPEKTKLMEGDESSGVCGLIGLTACMRGSRK